VGHCPAQQHPAAPKQVQEQDGFRENRCHVNGKVIHGHVERLYGGAGRISLLMPCALPIGLLVVELIILLRTLWVNQVSFLALELPKEQ
jgi:hypothetical protein